MSVSDDAYSALSKSFADAGEFCDRSDSPFSARLLEKTAALFNSADPAEAEARAVLRAMFEPWLKYNEQQLFSLAISLRWIAAWHCISLRGVEPELTASYPSAEDGWKGQPDATWQQVLRLSSKHQEWIAQFLQHEPQTNEVNRCVLFLPTFLLLAKQFPNNQFDCFEIGSSAGLNTFWPKFHYKLNNDGSVTWGDDNSKVRLSANNWHGHPITAELASTPLAVASINGCDRKLFDLSQESERLRLRSYCWADQGPRVERLQAALQLAANRPPQIQLMDAADFVEANVKLTPGRITILYHSFVWQYLPEETQQRIRSHIEKVGADATPEKPLAWMSVETCLIPGTYYNKNLVKVQVWPGGKETLISECHPHGRWNDIKHPIDQQL